MLVSKLGVIILNNAEWCYPPLKKFNVQSSGGKMVLIFFARPLVTNVIKEKIQQEIEHPRTI